MNVGIGFFVPLPSRKYGSVVPSSVPIAWLYDQFSSNILYSGHVRRKYITTHDWKENAASTFHFYRLYNKLQIRSLFTKIKPEYKLGVGLSSSLRNSGVNFVHYTFEELLLI